MSSTLSTVDSSWSWYHGICDGSVSRVSAPAALVFVLAGAEGDYGVKDTADALLPNVAGGTPSP